MRKKIWLADSHHWFNRRCHDLSECLTESHPNIKSSLFIFYYGRSAFRRNHRGQRSNLLVEKQITESQNHIYFVSEMARSHEENGPIPMKTDYKAWSKIEYNGAHSIYKMANKQTYMHSHKIKAQGTDKHLRFINTCQLKQYSSWVFVFMPIVGTPFLCKQYLTEEEKKTKKNDISIKTMIMLTHFCITFAPIRCPWGQYIFY